MTNKLKNYVVYDVNVHHQIRYMHELKLCTSTMIYASGEKQFNQVAVLMWGLIPMKCDDDSI